MYQLSVSLLNAKGCIRADSTLRIAEYPFHSQAKAELDRIMEAFKFDTSLMFTITPRQL